jgi:hypothetical protein
MNVVTIRSGSMNTDTVLASISILLACLLTSYPYIGFRSYVHNGRQSPISTSVILRVRGLSFTINRLSPLRRAMSSSNPPWVSAWKKHLDGKEKDPQYNGALGVISLNAAMNLTSLT